MSIEQEALDSMKYQRWLAESLAANLGYDKAVRICIELCWYGTLDFLMKEKDKHSADARHRVPALTEAA